MKSLSPNAQEFIPVSYQSSLNNNEPLNTPPHGVMFIPQNGSTLQQQVIHGFIPQTSHNQFFPPSPTNSTSISNTGSNNQLNMFGYPSQMPLNPALLSHQYNVFYQSYQPNNQQIQRKQTQNISSYKEKNFNKNVKNNHQRQKSGDSFTFSQQNRKVSNSKLTLANSSARNINVDGTKPSNVPLDITEKEWPTLEPTDNKLDEKLKGSNSKVETQISSDTESTDEEPLVSGRDVPETWESRVVDQSIIKKLCKTQNVELFKKTVECHYNNENSNEKNSKSFSFREALLKQPVKVKPVKAEPTKTKIINNAELAAKTLPESIETTTKSRRRKRNKKSQQLTDENPENTKTDKSARNSQFNLIEEDFPDLSNLENSLQVVSRSNKSTVNNSSIEDNDVKSNLYSDAYSSDATVDVCLKTQSCSQLSDKKLNLPSKPSGKKQNRPYIVDFANMISALENGQNKTKGQKATVSSMTRSKSQTILKSNPLDSCPTVLRGKEREKPKQKKQSTLKKIILKEREEKRLLKSGAISAEILDEKLSSLDIDKTTGEISEANNELVIGSTSSTNAKVSESEEELEEGTNEDSDENEIKNSETKETNEQNDPEVIFLHEEDLKQNVMSNQMSPISQGSPISIGGYTPTTGNTLDQLSTNKALICIEKLEEQVKQKIHNRKFREYCNQIINREIDEVCSLLLHEIVRFQDRLYYKNPATAKAKRRYVMGIREVTKHLKLKKLRCIILAPNCEKIQSKGGLDDAINTIIQMSMEQNVPFLFALGRKSLGKAVNKLVPISVVGIFDYAGAEDHFRRLVTLANNAKLAYQEMIEEYEKEECETLITEVKQSMQIRTNSQSNLFMAPSYLGHSRTSSNGSNISIDPNILFQHHHGHKRSASGNFNMGHSINTNTRGHHRSASGGGGVAFNSMSLSEGGKQHWTHSRTPSNCSNNSFISRVSEPISEVGSCGTLHYTGVTSASQYNLVPYYVPNNPPLNGQMANVSSSGASLAAVQYYSEQVRQEMRESNPENFYEQHQPDESCQVQSQTSAELNNLQGSLVNLHLGCINEIDQGNEADTEDTNPNPTRKQTKSIEQNSITNKASNRKIE